MKCLEANWTHLLLFEASRFRNSSFYSITLLCDVFSVLKALHYYFSNILTSHLACYSQTLSKNQWLLVALSLQGTVSVVWHLNKLFYHHQFEPLNYRLLCDLFILPESEYCIKRRQCLSLFLINCALVFAHLPDVVSHFLRNSLLRL